MTCQEIMDAWHAATSLEEKEALMAQFNAQGCAPTGPDDGGSSGGTGSPNPPPNPK